MNFFFSPTTTFTNKLALIAGGSSGCGRATAKALLKKGVSGVIIVARREIPIQETVDELSKEIQENKAETPLILGFSIDLSKWDQVERLVSQILSQYGFPQIVVYSAAAGDFLLIEEENEESIRNSMETTYFGCAFLFHHLLSSLFSIKSKSSSTSLLSLDCSLSPIFPKKNKLSLPSKTQPLSLLPPSSLNLVVVGSPTRISPLPYVSYSSSRSALYGFCESLRTDLNYNSPFPITVTYCEPSRLTEGSYLTLNPQVVLRLPFYARTDKVFGSFPNPLCQSPEQVANMIISGISSNSCYVGHPIIWVMALIRWVGLSFLISWSYYWFCIPYSQGGPPTIFERNEALLKYSKKHCDSKNKKEK